MQLSPPFAPGLVRPGTVSGKLLPGPPFMPLPQVAEACAVDQDTLVALSLNAAQIAHASAFAPAPPISQNSLNLCGLTVWLEADEEHDLMWLQQWRGYKRPISKAGRIAARRSA
jgi:hypothetical protein